MAISPNIGCDNLEANVVSPHTPHNTAINKLDDSLNAIRTETFADANITMTGPNFLEAGYLILNGSVTAQRDLIVPEDFTLGSDTVTVSKHFWVQCDTTGGNIRVIPGSGTGSVILSAGDRVLLYTDGTDVIAIPRLPRVARDDHTYPNVAVEFMIDVPDGATGDIDVVIDPAFRVTDVWLIKISAAGGASDTIQVKETANVITDAMDINVADQVIVRASTIDDAQWDIPAGGTLRVTRTKISAADVACKVFVKGVLI